MDERVFVSLGLLKVAACLEQSAVPVEVVDLSGIDNFTEAIGVHASFSSSRVWAITSTTPQMPSAYKIAQTIRQENRQAKLILGGPHPTLTHAAVKKESVPGRAHRAYQNLLENFDVVVCGDGEHAIFDALEMVDKNERGTVEADDPKRSTFLKSSELDSLPFPARHLIDMDSYHYFIDGEPATSLICQLGCPFGCGFCGGRASPMLRRVRTRTTENVVAEMRHLYQTYGYKGFMLYDDELNVNPRMIEMMEAITRLQEDLGVSFKLRGFIKAQLFTQEQAQAMYRAGFRWILTGFESGSPRILRNIQKKASREDNTRCTQIAKGAGLKVKALMSIGHPGESHQTLSETEDWLLENKPEDFDITIITPYPGSPYYDEAVIDKQGNWVYTYAETGDRLYAREVDYFKTADYYKGDPNGGYQSYVWTDTLPAEELVLQRDHMERRVRSLLGIPFNLSAPAQRYEHSMGQTGLGPRILRRSKILLEVA